jgi:putative lipoprotein
MIRPNKKIAIFCFALFLSLYQISHAENKSEKSFLNENEKADTLNVCDRWLAWDKVEHFGVSAYLSAVSYKIYHDFYNNHREPSLYFSGILTLSLGLGKELYDKKKPNGKFSYKDLVADVLGIGVGLWIATR